MRASTIAAMVLILAGPGTVGCGGQTGGSAGSDAAPDASGDASPDIAAPILECRPACASPPCVLAEKQALPLRLVLDDRWVYWTTRGKVVDNYFSGGTVSRVEKTGADPVVLVPDQPDAMGLAVDADFVYWTVESAAQGNGSVRRAAKDGSGARVLAQTYGGPRALTLDDTQVYYEGIPPLTGTPGGESWGLYAVAKTGGPARRLSAGNTARAIVPDGADLFLAREFPGAILRAPKAGGAVSVVVNDRNSPWPLAVDRGRLFWATYAIGGTTGGPEAVIVSANKDGTDVRTLVELPPGQTGIRALALGGDHVYWIDHDDAANDGRIMRVRKDVSEAAVLVSGQDQPTDIVVDGCSVYWTTLGSHEGTGTIRSMPLQR